MGLPDISKLLSAGTLASLRDAGTTLQAAGVVGEGEGGKGDSGKGAALGALDLTSKVLDVAAVVNPALAPAAATATTINTAAQGLGTVTDAAEILAGGSSQREQTAAQPRHGIRAVDVSLEELGTGTAGRAGATPTFRQPALDISHNGGHRGIG